MPRRRPDRGNQWQLEIRVGGRRVRELHPADLTKREAEALEHRRRAEVEAETLGAADAWGTLAHRFWVEHGRRLAWADSVSGHLDALSDAIGDHRAVRKITADTFTRAIVRWRQTIAPATINRRLAVARALWTRASDLWGIAMPVIPWRLLAQPVPDRIPPYITPAEREAVMQHAAPHVALAMKIALATGWRRASVLGLRWEQVDWQHGRITGRGKGRAGGRVLVHPLTDELREILLAAHPQEAGPVVSYRGYPVIDIKKAFASARTAAGFPHVTFRDLRHSVAQEILAATDSLEAVQAVLDHDRVSTTARHYARFQLAQKERALAARGHQMGTKLRGTGASNGSRTRDLQSHNLAL
jgi:integrase